MKIKVRYNAEWREEDADPFGVWFSYSISRALSSRSITICYEN